MTGLSLEFASKWFLFGLVLLPLVYWLSRRSLSGLGRGRRITAVVLRTLAVLLLVLGLARTRVFKSDDSLCVFFVADRSYSILPERWELILEEIASAQRDMRSVDGDRVGLILFGREAGIEVSAQEGEIDFDKLEFQTLIRPEATDIQSAIRLAVAAFPQGVGGKRLVLFTDGNENRGAVLEEVRSARSLGVTVDVVPVRSAQPAEIWVDKVVVDPEVQVGQPFDLGIVVSSTEATRARILIYQNDTLIDQTGVVRDLEPGKNPLTVRGIRHDAPGFFDFEVRVEPLDRKADRVTQNNMGSAFVLIAGEPKVLLCLSSAEFEQEQQLEAPLLAALADERIGVDVVPAELLPRDAGEYLNYDAIIFSNVGAHELTEERMKLLHGLVEGVGLGFVMIGGQNSFGAGGYQGTPIERLLPVDMEVKQKKILPNGALAVVVHSCELGNGNWWARKVVQKAIRILSPRDYCGVLYHDDLGGEKWLFPMWPCSKKQMMLGRLKNFNPGDMMSFQQIFKLALTGLQGTPASVKHMIILSDGDPGAPNPSDVKQITSGRSPVTISTICYGAHGGTIPPIMRDLAKKGKGKFYHLRDPKKLPEIFIREATTVRKSLISNDPFFPQVLAHGAVLQGLRDERLPQLGGYVLSTAKPLADVLIVRPPVPEDPTQDPILATWNYGLGKSVAFTSDARPHWGKRWTGWGSYQKFWSQLVRWVSRSRSPVAGRVTRQIRGGEGKIIFDAINETTGALDSTLRIEAKVVSPDHETRDVVGRQTRPGRYEFDIPADVEGTHTVTLQYVKDGQKSSFTTGLTVPYSPEFRHRDPNAPLLQRIADASDGRYVAGLANVGDVDLFSRDFPRSWDVQDIWRGLLTTALLLFFADIVVRRVMIDYRGAVVKAAALVARVLPGRRKRDTAEDVELANLLRRKQEMRDKQRERAAAWELTAGSAGDAGDADDAPKLDAAFDASAAPSSESAADKPKPKKAKKPEPEPAEEGGYTSRLLAAKRRALDKRRGDDR